MMMRRAAKRRRTEKDKYSWVNMTAVPHEDGYQWRKYGEKKIHGTHFTSRMVKQEPQAALPPVAAEVVTPCQEPFPVSNSHCGMSPYDIGIPPPTASTNTSAVYSDELECHLMGQTTTTTTATVMDHEPELGDDPFSNDPHLLLLLYDSFKYY